MAAYKQIREYIVSRILSGEYSPNQMIEPQDFFNKKFGVSRATTRKAFEELIEKKILYSEQGRGTFVANLNVNRVKALRKVSFSESERKKTHTFSSRLVGVFELNADIKLAKQLKIEVGDKVVCIKRVRLVNGFAENYQISYLNHSLVKGINFTDEILEDGSLFQLLKDEASLEPYYTDEEVRAISASEDISSKLSIAMNEPILFIRRHTYTISDVVMEYCEDYECSHIKGLKIRTFAESKYI